MRVLTFKIVLKYTVHNKIIFQESFMCPIMVDFVLNSQSESGKTMRTRYPMLLYKPLVAS